MKANIIVALLLALSPFTSASANVVINEVFYNAPNDLDDVQWIELHNPSEQTADLSNWQLDKGKAYTFPTGTKITPHGYLIVALKPEAFRKHYTTDAMGPLARTAVNIFR